MLEVRNLSFDYPGRRALDKISFTLEASSVTALIGPNGAGKSTLMRVMAALDRPSEGSVTLAGRDVHKDPRKAHEIMGFLPDFFGLYNELNVEHCLLFHARAQNMAKEKISLAIRQVAEKVGLQGRLKDKAGHLSRGLRQRLAIAQAIIHQPQLLILDEPASGLDPLARAELSLLLKNLNREGMTILVSSHILNELEDYSTHMLALEEGHILAHEKLHQPAGDESLSENLEIHITFTEIQAGLEEKLRSYSSISHIQMSGYRASLRMIGTERERAQLLRDLIFSGFHISSFSRSRQGLQAAYLAKLKAEAK